MRLLPRPVWMLPGLLFLLSCTRQPPPVPVVKPAEAESLQQKSAPALESKPTPTATRFTAADWLARYRAEWQRVPGLMRADDQAVFLQLGTHIPSTVERQLLNELAAQPFAERLSVLKHLLSEAKMRLDVPIEFAAHAALGGDRFARDQVNNDLLRPGVKRTDLTPTERNVYYRLALELEAVAELPDLARPLGEFLLAFKPDQPLPTPPNLTLRGHLLDLANRVPKTHQHELLEAVTAARGLPPPRKPVPLMRPICEWDQDESSGDRGRFMERFENLLRPLFDLPLGPPLTSEELLVLKRGDASPPEIEKLLQRHDPRMNPLSAAEKQLIASKAAQVIIDAPEKMSTPIEELEVFEAAIRVLQQLTEPLDPAVTAAVAEKLFSLKSNFHHTLKSLGDEWSQTLFVTPREQAASILTSLGKLAPRVGRGISPRIYSDEILGDLLQKLTPDEAKNIIRELTPLFTAENKYLVHLLVLVGEQTEAADREKFHAFLITRMKVLPPPRTTERANLTPRDLFADALAQSTALSPTTADAVIELAYPPISQDQRHPDKPDNQLAGESPHRVTHGKLIVRASPVIRQQQLDYLVARLPERDILKHDLHAFATLGEVAPELTPAEATPIGAALIDAIDAHIHTTEFVNKFILGRPQSERAGLFQRLGPKIMEGSGALSRTYASALVIQSLRNLPASAAAPLIQDALLKKQFYFISQGELDCYYLELLCRRLPPGDQAQIHGRLVELAQKSSLPTEAQVATRLALAVPNPLSAEHRLNLATKFKEAIVATFQAEIKGGLLIGTEGLGDLLAELPPAQSRPLLLELLTAAEQAMNRVEQANPPPTHEVGWLVRASVWELLRYRGDLSPDEVARITRLYVRINMHIGGHRFAAHEINRHRSLPPGVAQQLIAQVLASYEQQQAAKNNRTKETVAALTLIGQFVPSAEAEACIEQIRTKFPPQQFAPRDEDADEPEGQTFEQQAELLAGYLEELPPAAAAKWCDQMARDAEEATELPRKEYLESLWIAALPPLAKSDPQQFLQRVARAKLAIPQQNLAFAQVAHVQNPAQIVAILAGELSPELSLKKPEQNSRLAAVIHALPLAARLRMTDAAIASGKFSPAELTVFAQPYEEVNAFEPTKSLLREPDRVGLRRRIVVRAAPLTIPSDPTFWQQVQ